MCGRQGITCGIGECEGGIGPFAGLCLWVWVVHPIRRQCARSDRVQRPVTGAEPGVASHRIPVRGATPLDVASLFKVARNSPVTVSTSEVQTLKSCGFRRVVVCCRQGITCGIGGCVGGGGA